MIHVITAHHQSDRWIDLQLAYLQRHLAEPYRTVASLEGIDGVHAAKFDQVVPSLGMHAGKLNLLASIVCDDVPDDDLLMFLDGDAFPIADPMPVVRGLLASAKLVAVRRAEELGDGQPHPLFCVTTVGLWKMLRGDWSQGHPWINDAGEEVTDVGGNLLFLLEQAGVPWASIERTNRHNPHPVFYGVYGDVVYHHGAGFRARYTRWDKVRTPPPSPPTRFGGTRLGKALRKLYRARKRRWMRVVEEQTAVVSERIFTQAQTDHDFHLQFR